MVEQRVEEAVQVGGDRRRMRHVGRVGDAQRSVLDDTLRANHERTQAILAQRAGIRREWIDDRAGLEEIRWIETERDAALQVDSTNVDVASRRWLEARIPFAQVVFHVFALEEPEVLVIAYAEASAVHEQ